MQSALSINNADISDVGHGVHVANFRGCDLYGGRFSRSVHIWYGPKGDQSGVCNCIRSGGSGIVLEYTDLHSLSAVMEIDRLADYFSSPGEVLIHCAAGQCRGPTVAMIAKLVRAPEITPWHAMHDITWSLWTHRRAAPLWGNVPLSEIFEWWERRRQVAASKQTEANCAR